MSVDIETFSSVDIKKSGLYKYAGSPDFSILLFAYSVNGSEVNVQETITDDIKELLFNPEITKHAYNAAFEWFCLSSYFGLNTEQRNRWLGQWRCTQLHGLYCGYPMGLEAVGKALGLPQDKRKLAAGKALIKTFCSPCRPTKTNGWRSRTLPEHEPDRWRLFKEYCGQDVVSEMEIDRRLSAFPVPESVQKQWELDQIQNARGVAVDMELIDGALYIDKVTESENLRQAVEITRLENPKSVSQLKSWIEERTERTTLDLTKDTVEDMLKTDLPDDVREALSLRKELGKTSTKKYTAMKEAAGADKRLRGMLQFYGANRTGRWAGRLVQVQNLPRTYLHGDELDTARKFVREKNINALKLCFGSVPDTLSQLVRTAFVPEKGNIFIDADFSAIEARVIAWLAGESWVLDVFRTHGKIYEAAASQMFNVPIELIKKGNPEYSLRQKGKVATLALGYQGGVGALISMGALKMGIPEDELPEIVSKWRAANPAIVRCWKAIESAAAEAIERGRPVGTRGLIFSREADIENDLDFLKITLPSGRGLYYAKPHIDINRWGGKSIGYYGMDQNSKKWTELETYGGKLTENIVQAIARDLLAYNIEKLEKAGYSIVFHIHDEVVIEAPDNSADELKKVCDIMSAPAPFAPDLPMAADGWTGYYFTKD